MAEALIDWHIGSASGSFFHADGTPPGVTAQSEDREDRAEAGFPQRCALQQRCGVRGQGSD